MELNSVIHEFFPHIFIRYVLVFIYKSPKMDQVPQRIDTNCCYNYIVEPLEVHEYYLR